MATKNVRRSRSGGGLFDIESPMAIELRRIMIRLGRRLDLDRKRAIMITSSERGEGKSLFSLHFALVLAYHLDKKILLLDADVRRPVQHSVFNVPLEPGLAELLSGDAGFSGAAHPTKVDNLFFLPAGHSGGNPSRLFSGSRLRETVNRLQNEEWFDIVLFDSPPVVPVSDPLHYIAAVDGTLYLCMAGITHRDVAERGIQILKSAGANILGIVANNLGEVLPYYYDRKYYGYSR
jgi:capsular exopolysaccharide synthesis family protein